MRCVAINHAEAIIEPFWDGSASDNPIDKVSVLQEYKLNYHKSVKAKVEQKWHAIGVTITRGDLVDDLVIMERECNINIEKYDVFRVFGAISQHTTFKVDVRIDGKWHTSIDLKEGASLTEEMDGDISGQILTAIRLSFGLTKVQKANNIIYWLGLSNRERQKDIDEYVSPYTDEWEYCFSLDNPTYSPECNIYFNETDLKEIRENTKIEPYKTVFDKMRAEAKLYLDDEPEKLVGEFVPWGDRRWCRDRDAAKNKLSKKMEILAFVGLIEKDMKMSKMACRMALSIAHCDKWTESIMGCLPGATWHHRSFTECTYLMSCALVLDWAGHLLTPYGTQIITDAMVMKGLPRVESDFKRVEYIRHMNQGLHFNEGRIIAYLALINYYPRYKMRIDEAATDLIEMVDSYVNDDGGTLEGASYWNYTFSGTLPEFYLLSKFYNIPLSKYASDSMKKTTEYGLIMQSLAKNGVQYIPINDAHPGNKYAIGLTAACTILSDNDEWKRIYANQLVDENVDGDVFWLVLAPQIKDIPVELKTEAIFSKMMTTGQVRAMRDDVDLGLTNFHYTTGPTYECHNHGDKGNFVLEIEDEAIFIERGSSSYADPESNVMQTTERHNILCPYDEDGDYYSQTIASGFFGKLITANCNNDCLNIVSDDAKAWEDGYFNSLTREIISKDVRQYTIIDKGEYMKENGGVAIIFHTIFPIEECDKGYMIRTEKANVKVYYAENVTPSKITGQPLSYDGLERNVNTITFYYDNVSDFNIITKIEIEPK